MEMSSEHLTYSTLYIIMKHLWMSKTNKLADEHTKATVCVHSGLLGWKKDGHILNFLHNNKWVATCNKRRHICEVQMEDDK